MNKEKTLQIFQEWADFEERYPDAGIEDFYRYQLTALASKRKDLPNFGGGVVPTAPKSFLMKLIGYLSRSSAFYYEKAFRLVPEIKQKEDFYLLNTLKTQGERRKTELINEHLLEISTGMDILNRLLAAQLISERNDPTDRRAKILQLTPLGDEVLNRCYQVAIKANEIMLSNLSDEDILLCIQLLKNVEARQTALVFEMRDKGFEEIYAAVVK